MRFGLCRHDRWGQRRGRDCGEFIWSVKENQLRTEEYSLNSMFTLWGATGSGLFSAGRAATARVQCFVRPYNRPMNRVILADNLTVLPTLADGSVDLIYIDPPFNTGEAQTRLTLRDGARRRGRPDGLPGPALSHGAARHDARYADMFDDYLAFLEPRLREAHRRARADGHALLPHRLSRGALLQGAARWDLRARLLPERGHLGLRLRRAHDEEVAAEARHILVYVEGRRRATTSTPTPVERIPYMAPGLVGPEKAARGKLPTDTWWHTIVPTNGKERTGYPTQKPLGILRRIVQRVARRAGWCSTSSPAAARPARRASSLAGGSCSSMTTRRRSR